MKLDDVMTTKEASERWNISQVAIKKSCTGQKNIPPRFKENECKKSGGTWLVTKTGMERLYGKEQHNMVLIDNGKKVKSFNGSYLEALREILELQANESPCPGILFREDIEESLQMAKEDEDIKIVDFYEKMLEDLGGNEQILTNGAFGYCAYNDDDVDSAEALNNLLYAAQIGWNVE